MARRIGFSAVVLVCCFWVLCHAYLVDANSVRVCAFLDSGIPAPERMPVFLFETAFDGYTWNYHAEHLGAKGQWRLRWTDFDHAPEGREVHWNSAFAWYLRGLGEGYRHHTGETLRNSMFRASIWANPILLVLALLVLPVLAARRYGSLSGSVVALGMISGQTFYDGFTPGYPDHHGLIALALLGMVLGIVWAGAGWVQAGDGDAFGLPTSVARARRWMIFSALCGAAGLWFSAVSATMLLLAVGSGALAAALTFGRAPADAVFQPLLWRVWAFWGAAASLVFYLIEYFPQHMGWRLEVNHPLYALAWLGGGGILAIAGEWLATGARKPFPWRRLVWPALAAAALPLTILIGGEAVYTMRNGLLLRIHAYLEEFLPLARLIANRHTTWFMAVGGFPALPALTALPLLSNRTPRGTKAVLLTLLVTAILMAALQLCQARWGLLAELTHIALAGVLIPQLWRLLPVRGAGRLAGVAGMLALGFVFLKPATANKFPPAWKQYRQGARPGVDFGQGIALLHRQVARTIRNDAAGRPVVLLSSPDSSCMLGAFGGFRTVGTFYWENVGGLETAARMLTARTDAEALALMRAHGVTHVVLMPWGDFTAPFLVALGESGTTLQNTFAYRVLVNGAVPPGTRRLPFPPTDSPHELARQLDQRVVLLKVE
ncbi:MAG: hypothetical protein K8T26_05735 [Lentisphaerae bacterium]|nr:hypothetical protein [Lentisphaerota bacterium]